MTFQPDAPVKSDHPESVGHHAAAHGESSAMTHMPSHLRLWVITFIGLAADLWTKDWAFDTLRADERRVVVENLCSLQLSLNPGALFGLGAGMAPVFVGASVLALLFVLYLFANARASRWSMHLALGLVLGGALGNLYDRATQQAYVAYVNTELGQLRIIGDMEGESTPRGFSIRQPNAVEPTFIRGEIDAARSGMQPVVRDFIRIEARVGDYSIWPWIFNIADALLVVGVVILLLNFWQDHRQHNAMLAAQQAESAAVAGAPGARDNPAV